MCEYCEGRKPLSHEDNENELGSCCGIVKGTHQRSDVRIIGHYLRINSYSMTRTAKDCYYMAALDECSLNEVEDKAHYHSFYDQIKLTYCPVCGRKLDTVDVDIADAKADIGRVEWEILETETFLKDFSISVLIQPNGYIATNVLPDRKTLEQVRKTTKQARKSIELLRQYCCTLTMANADDVCPADLKPFPVDSFISSSDWHQWVGKKPMRTSVSGLRKMMTILPARTFDGWDYEDEVTEELLKAHADTVNECETQLKELKAILKRYQILIKSEKQLVKH